MSRRLSVDLEVSTVQGSPRPLRLVTDHDAPTGDVLDALGRHLGLTGADGAVQARSLVSGVSLPRSGPVGRLPLLRGERLSLSVGLSPAGPTGSLARWPGHGEPDASGRVAVRRPPRDVRPEPRDAVQLPVRRTVRAARRFPLGSMLIPLLLGAALVAVTRRWEVALFAVFSPVMVGWNYVEERRARRDEIAEHGATYAQAVEGASARIRGAAAAWADWLHRHHPSPGELLPEVLRLGTRLWERQPGDPDFLALRVGLATRVAPVELKRDEWREPREEEHDFRADAVVGPVPAVTSLAAGALAVLGDETETAGCVAWLVAQLSALHSPADVLVVGALPDSPLSEWVGWLPHLATGLLPVPPTATDAAGTAQLLEAVAALGRERRERAGARQGAAAPPWVVVLVDERVGADAALLNEVVACRDVGVATLWFGRDARSVPTTVSTVLEVGPGGTARLRGVRDGTDLAVALERLGAAEALDLSSALAAVRDAGDNRRVASVPERVVLEDLVPDLVSPTALRRRWGSASPETLLARLGATADGPLDLDLGPGGSHVLLGGTTGSGKSELLQTLVASLAAAYPPDRVSFLLVDYKGGAAFKDAMRFPHCVGVVTDLDEHLTRRVLRALEAEIKRREELLAGAGARDVAELRRVRPDVALEELVIVVDEFAALAKEIPEFVDGVVDLAARGRSLGLRLVLATQRPAGVVNERIRANVGARIALRVNDEADSLDVIDDRRAAHVPRRLAGRGYQRVHRDLVEFQSAYVGGPARSSTTAPVEVLDLDDAATPVPAHARTSHLTTLEALVEATERVMRLGGFARPHVPWLPALPTVVRVADLEEEAGEPAPEGTVPLGLADLPERQQRRLLTLDLDRQRNLMVFGTSRSGKTTTLRTLAAGLLQSLPPAELQLFCLDFAGHGLHVLADAPHCLAVTGPDDLGRVARVLRRLQREVESRKRDLAASGAVSFDSLVDPATGRAAPRVVVLVDGYSGVVSSLERPEGGRLLDVLEQVIREGAAVGVHVVLTADRRASVPNSVSSVVTTRLVLRLAERDEYAVLGVDSALASGARLTPGRGFIQGTTEVQVAVWHGADPAAEQRALADLVRSLRERHTRAFTVVGRMPTSVEARELPPAPDTWVLPFAVGEREVAPVHADLRDSHLLVAGPARSGRTSTLRLLAQVASRAPVPAAPVLLVARRPGSYEDHGLLQVVDVHDTAALEAAVSEMVRRTATGEPVLCCCDDVDLFPDQVSSALEQLARTSRDTSLRFVVATDNRAGLRAYAGLVPEVRKSKQAVLLSPELDIDGDLVGVRLRSPLDSPHAPGRAVLVADGLSELIQVATGDVPAPRPTHVSAGDENRGVR